MTAKEIRDMHTSIHYWLKQMQEAMNALTQITARLMDEVEKGRNQ